MQRQRSEEAEKVPKRLTGVSAAEVLFRQLLEKIPAAAYTCDRDGRITFYNSQAAELWGREPQLLDSIDRYCGSHKLFAMDGTAIRHDQCWMARALQENCDFHGREILIERPDGVRLTAMAYASPLHDEVGNVTGGVNVLVDISDHKHAEEKLEAADRAKDEFLATLAHELRNPLAPLRNAAQVLRMHEPESPETRWALEVIERQTQQMTRLIDDLLDVSRITRNKLELRTQRVEFAEIVRVAVETSRPLIEAAGHELTISLPAAPLYLNADLTRLSQALANMLNNAAKYMEKNGHIWLSAVRQAGEVVVSVRDSGIGLPREVLPKVFDMFTQVSRTLKRQQSGLGIGLSLVKRLVELHGGRVEVKSEGPGHGSEFIMRLPVLMESKEPQKGKDGEPSAVNGHGGLKILVADDNHDSADSLAMLLRMTGNEVRAVYNGAEAVRVAKEFVPDVALLDIGMPEMSGCDAARRIREEVREEMVLIALTGWGQESDRQRSREAGFDHHMVKPVNPGGLVRFLGEIRKGMQK